MYIMDLALNNFQGLIYHLPKISSPNKYHLPKISSPNK